MGFSLSDLTGAITNVVGWFDDGVKRDASTDYAIRTRVADAKAAGIHPLYAMGAPTQSSQFIAGQPPTGSSVGAVMDYFQTRKERQREQALQDSKTNRDDRLADAQVDALKAQKERDEAAAVRDLSEAARATQAAMVQPTRRPAGLPNKYIPIRNNYTGDIEWTLNPDLGFELPEVVGGYHYGKAVAGPPKPKPPLTPRQKKRYGHTQRRSQ